MRRRQELPGAAPGMLSRKGTFSFPSLSLGAARAAPGPCQEGKGRWRGESGYRYSRGPESSRGMKAQLCTCRSTGLRWRGAAAAAAPAAAGPGAGSIVRGGQQTPSHGKRLLSGVQDAGCRGGGGSAALRSRCQCGRIHSRQRAPERFIKNKKKKKKPTQKTN